MEIFDPIKIAANCPIFIIDDQIDEFELITIGFKRSKLRQKLFHFLSGKLFFEYLESENLYFQSKFSLVLVDINMHGIGGFEVLERIKTQEDFHEFQICIMSNVDDFKDIEKAKEGKAHAFIKKPLKVSGYTEFFDDIIVID
ncbi:MAG: response regulator [Bdellovibrionales bacterium]|nr:response regulator [Bdellovibrionales bacterium]